MNAGRLMTYGTLLHRPKKLLKGVKRVRRRDGELGMSFFLSFSDTTDICMRLERRNVGDARDNETILREIKRERVETEGWPIVSAVTPYSLYRAATRVARCTVFVIGVHIELCNGTPYAQEDSFQPRQMKTAEIHDKRIAGIVSAPSNTQRKILLERSIKCILITSIFR